MPASCKARRRRSGLNDKITAEQAARRLGISISTLWRWREAGKIEEAGRAGRTVMFYALDVDRLLGIDETRDLTLADVYMRLAGVESWEEVDAIRRDIAATLCSHASDEGRKAVERSYRATCALAATHPDKEIAERIARRARVYGAWLRITEEETDKLIARRAQGSYEKAREEYADAPQDPAYEVARLESSR